MANAEHRYPVLIAWSDADQMFVAICPDFTDVSALGDTLEDALKEFQIALDLTVEAYEEEGNSLPTSRRIQQLDLLVDPRRAAWREREIRREEAAKLRKPDPNQG
jgi:predicted RNase H-like HicB family nuclease